MNELSINNIRIRLARSTASIVLACAAVMTVSALMAASDWPPDDATRDKMINAFSTVLTHAAKPGEGAFRKQITGPASMDAAKAAVQEELDKQNGTGNVVIPTDVVIMFYEPEETQATASASNWQSNADAFEKAWKGVRSAANHKYHVFSLPPIDGKQHFYKEELKCCYPVWPPHKPTTPKPIH